MPPINEEKVETYLRHEKQYQSNLEYKFSKIKGIPDGVKELYCTQRQRHVVDI